MRVGEFEGHITLDLQQARDNKAEVKLIGRLYEMHYSEIAGWDEIKPGHHAFLTCHDVSQRAIMHRMFSVKTMLSQQCIDVQRIKVELCTYDSKSNERG